MAQNCANIDLKMVQNGPKINLAIFGPNLQTFQTIFFFFGALCPLGQSWAGHQQLRDGHQIAVVVPESVDEG